MFAKIFGLIFDSSIADDPALRHFFMDLLVLADSSGRVDMTVNAIAGRTRLPASSVVEWLARLELPDPDSKTPDAEGKRIVRLDSHRSWGWQIVNYQRYRESATKEMLRMAEAERKSEYRRRRGFGTREANTGKSNTEENTEAEPSRTCPGHVPDKSSELLERSVAIEQSAVSGVSPDFAAYVHDDWACRGGKDAAGNSCRWLPYVTKRWNRERSQWMDGSHKGRAKKAKANTDPNI